MSITEEMIRNAILKELLTAHGQRRSIPQLIDRLTGLLKPTGRDAQIAYGRSDTYFSQKVRNTVSHRNQSTGLQARGLADYDAQNESWTLTARGRSFTA